MILVSTVFVLFAVLLVDCDSLLESSTIITTRPETVSVNVNVIVRDVNCNNERPVIGILSLPSWNEELQVEENRSSYIAASYVKYLESAGARVVPVLTGRDESYYQTMVNLTNGILFTGGGLDLNTSIYTKAASHIWKHVININSEGDFYPIWGTCLGFELIAYLANNLTWPLTVCSSWDKPSNLNFTLNPSELKSTQMFNESDESIVEILRSENVTINYHKQCLTPETVERSNRLRQMFRILSTNKDTKGVEFVSIMEGITLPIYGVQFHPERVLYEPIIVKSYRKTPHSSNAVKVSQYFANFFVNQARKNCHIYPDSEEYHSKLIYNYCPQFTGLVGSHEQTYFFNW